MKYLLVIKIFSLKYKKKNLNFYKFNEIVSLMRD